MTNIERHSMQDTETLLIAAKSLMDNNARDRALRAKILAEGEGDPWFMEIFGNIQSRCANIDADIADRRGRLEAIREDLLARGLTQEDCRALWVARIR